MCPCSREEECGYRKPQTHLEPSARFDQDLAASFLPLLGLSEKKEKTQCHLVAFCPCPLPLVLQGPRRHIVKTLACTCENFVEAVTAPGRSPPAGSRQHRTVQSIQPKAPNTDDPRTLKLRQQKILLQWSCFVSPLKFSFFFLHLSPLR